MSYSLPNGKRRRRVDEEIEPLHLSNLNAGLPELPAPIEIKPFQNLQQEVAILRQENKVLDQKLNAIYQVLGELKLNMEKQGIEMEKNFNAMNSFLQPPPLPKELPSYYS